MYDVGGTRNSVSSLVSSMISLMYPIMISVPRGRHTSMMVRSQCDDLLTKYLTKHLSYQWMPSFSLREYTAKIVLLFTTDVHGRPRNPAPVSHALCARLSLLNEDAVSPFDEKLAEDKRVNRLEDSYLLWRSVCANKLLSRTQLILCELYNLSSPPSEC